MYNIYTGDIINLNGTTLDNLNLKFLIKNKLKRKTKNNCFKSYVL